MKKVLLTSTALVAFGGAAVADVALSGRAEMGIFDNNGVATPGVQFFTDIDVTFTMSGETDNGLTFGASVDLDEGGAGSLAVANNSDDGGATIFISGAFGTVTMGDTDGAMDWALTEAGNVGNPGSLADDETTHAGYLGAYLDGGSAVTGANGDGQILRWDYSSGAFGVAVSVEDDNGSNAANSGLGYAIGFKYDLAISGGTVSFGVGYQRAADNPTRVGGFAPIANDPEMTGVSVSGVFDNGLSAGLTYTDISNNPVLDKHYSLGVGYTSGPFSVHANYGKYSGVVAAADRDGYGLAAAYDLGGGAVAHFGYGSGRVSAAAPRAKTMSLGLGLSF